MSTNSTPTAIRPLVVLATRILSGAETLGAVINLKANDAPTIAADLYALVGRPADPTATPPIAAIVGKQPAYVEARSQHTLARAARRAAEKTARDFCAQAVDTLKGPLGRSWNSRWEAVGFTNHSISLRGDPLPTLDSLAAHYRTHAEHETAALNLTSVKAEQVKQALVAGRAGAGTAHRDEILAKQARDAALAQLRLRVSLLRGELVGLLADEDPRWYDFGFRRPVDGETPDLIETVTLRLGSPGEVIVEWTKARLADNYRVSWKVTGSTGDPTQVGLFSDPQTVISGLSHPANITVIVTARNTAGESAPMEAAIVVP